MASLPPGFRIVSQPQQTAVPPVIEGPPRQPAPQTPAEAEAERLRVTRLYQDISQADRAPAETAASNADRRFQRISQIRTEFQNLPEVKAFNEVRNATQSIQRLATSVPHGAEGRAQADMAMVFAFMRALDPGSTVREGEFATAQNSAGVPERIRVAYNQALRGELLSPEQRTGFARSAGDLYMTRAQTYNERARMYQGLFQELGEDPNKHILIALGPERERERLAQQQERGEFQFDDQASELPQRGEAEFAHALRQGIANGELTTVDEIVRFGLDPRWNNGQGWRVDPTSAAAALRSTAGGVSMPEFTGMTAAERIAGVTDQISGEASGTDLLAHGATLGLSDEARGVGGAIHNIVSSPFTDAEFDPAGAYRDNRDAERIRLHETRERLGAGGTALEVIGGFASGRPSLGPIGAGPGGRTVWNNPTPPTLGGRVRQGAQIGAATGGVAGFGQGEGARNSLIGAAIGAGGGAAIGAGLPLAGAGVNALTTAARTASGRNPNVARNAIAGAIEADGNTPALVGRQMTQAQADGVPMMLADTGDNVRGLLAASTRAPGPARTMARDALESRQEGLSERVSGAVERDLGPAPNVDDAADDLMSQASTAAAPLFERAYARPGADAFTRSVAPLLSRPSMRRAMARARGIAEEEGRDPTTLGFDLNPAGEVTLTRVPSWQTLDYVKRGMDDVIETYRNTTTGRLQLDEEGKAINATLRQFLGQADKANPDWAAARAAWAGPVRARSAMEAGRRALLASPDDIHRSTRQFSESEMEFYRLGVRRAIVDMVSRRGDTADSVSAIIGTPARRAVLTRLFGGKSEFNRFIRTLQSEREGLRTFRRATQGSPTAQNLQDDAGLNSAVTTGLIDAATSGLPIATLLKRGADGVAARAGNQGREQIAALLSETDPARLMDLARELRKEAFRRRAAASRAGKRSTAQGMVAGQTASRGGNALRD